MFVQQGRSQVKSRGVTFLPAHPEPAETGLFSHGGTLRV
jgi:hypothetical protein